MELLVERFVNNSVKSVKLEYNMLSLGKIDIYEVSFCDVENLFTLTNLCDNFSDKLTIDEFDFFLNVPDIEIYEIINYNLYI